MPFSRIATNDNIDWSCPANRDAPLNRGLVAWWLALQNQPGWKSSQWLDLCDPLYGHTGTLTNMVPETAWQGAKGRPGGWGSIDIAGSTQKVETSTATNLPSGLSFTFGGWFAVRSYTSLANVFQYGAAPANTASEYNGRRRGILQFGDSIYFWGGAADWDTGISWDTTGGWHFIVFASDGANIYLNYDGNSVVSTTLPAGLTTLDPSDTYITLGDKHSAGTNSPEMLVDGAFIVSRYMPPAELTALYLDSIAGYPTTLNRVPMGRYAVQAAGGGTAPRGLLLMGCGA